MPSMIRPITSSGSTFTAPPVTAARLGQLGIPHVYQFYFFTKSEHLLTPGGAGCTGKKTRVGERYDCLR